MRTGFQTRVMRVRLLPPMLFRYSRIPARTMTTGHSSQFPRGSRKPRGGPAVGQRRGHLIWVEEIGGSSPPSWTRRPQDACYRPSGRRKRALRRKSAPPPAQGTRTPVVQLERAPAYEAGECRFESCRACCVRSGSGRCTGTWPRRKRVRVPPDTLKYDVLTRCNVVDPRLWPNWERRLA